MAKKTVETEIKEEVIVKNKETIKPKKRKVPSRDIEVRVVNMCDCKFLHVDSQTNAEYEFSAYGDFYYMTVGELHSLKMKHPKVLKEFMLYISEVDSDEVEIEDIISFLQLEKEYSNYLSEQDIDCILLEDDGKTFETKMNTYNSKDIIRISERAISLFKEREFSDSWKIKFIEDKMNKEDLFADIVDSIK